MGKIFLHYGKKLFRKDSILQTAGGEPGAGA